LNAEDELEGLVSQAGGKSTEFHVLRAKERLKAIGQRISSDEERLELIRVSTEEQVAAQRDELRWLEAILESQRTRLRSLMLRASGDGLVEEMLVERGSIVGGGVALARIALSDRLKAELQVYVSEGSEIEPGQAVSLESESAIVSGRVDEVVLAAGEKLLHVSVTLDENPRIPEGGSHKLHAMIQLEALDNVVSVELPAYAASNEWSSVFRLLSDGNSAERIKVRFGRGSVDRIEVLSGLEVGDRIIVSDVSGFDDLDLIEID
jgi:multidrug efflux pump subunit AcrA (membrane-fusion protein)